MGLIAVRGSNLHISRLDLEAQVLEAEGNIDSAEYAEEPISGNSLLKRLFR